MVEFTIKEAAKAAAHNFPHAINLKDADISNYSKFAKKEMRKRTKKNQKC